jgi:hypothetical protein
MSSKRGACTPPIATALLLFCMPAHAHVKRLVAHDVAQATLPIGAVLSGMSVGD